ncbi:MAG TPA: anthranilate synthase component I [Anaerolineae bacterium]|nr:anthranilate synthase component I [Anaerolineae bacterium]HMR63896.1 anthranilate synthase component I [Anaerolineae bacterium]
MYKPSLEQVEAMASQANLIPIYRDLPADMETPVSVYLKLQDEGPCFLLESVSGGEHLARYSFIGVRPRGVLTVTGNEAYIAAEGHGYAVKLENGLDPLSILKKEMTKYKHVRLADLPRFVGGAVGVISYDAVRRFERLPDNNPNELNLPEAAFMIAHTVVAFDHARQRLQVIANADLTRGDIRSAYRRAVSRIEEVVARLNAPLPEVPTPRQIEHNGLESNLSQTEFKELVRRAKEYIAAGDIFQVVLSQRLSRRTTAHPFGIYRALRMHNPSPYMVFMRFPGGIGGLPLHVIAASPEMHVRLEDGVAELRPIAGTRWRGMTVDEDEALARELLEDEKERAEHVMLVDLGRNDLGRVCQSGTVKPVELMVVERYSHVMHIVSDVQGKIKPDYDAFDLLRATFPAGTLTGAPKVRAMEIIDELENTRRGIYGGVIGHIGYDGTLDSCIAIRTVVMQGDRVHIQAGGGIVADSDPQREYEESWNKARALAEAVKYAEEHP